MKYSDRFKEEVVKAYADGVKVSEIMEKYDIYQDTLYRWLRENEISKRRTVYSEGFKEKVVEEYKEVGSTVPLTEKYGVTEPTICRWLEDAGVQRNTSYKDRFKDEVVEAYKEEWKIKKVVGRTGSFSSFQYLPPFSRYMKIRRNSLRSLLLLFSLPSLCS